MHVTALLCKRNLGQCMKFFSYAISQRDEKELLRQSFWPFLGSEFHVATNRLICSVTFVS